MKWTLVCIGVLVVFAACDQAKPKHDAYDELAARDSVAGEEAAQGNNTEAHDVDDASAPAGGAEGANRKGDSAWEDSFARSDIFDAANPDAPENTLINGLARMGANDTRALLEELRPLIDALEPGELGEVVPDASEALDPAAYTTRAYPIGAHAALVLVRANTEGAHDENVIEEDVPKSILLYDRVARKIAWHKGGSADLRPWIKINLHELTRARVLHIHTYSSGGTCAGGGDDVFFTATPEGVRGVLERGWFMETHTSETNIVVDKEALIITSEPVAKVARDKKSAVVEKIEETCKLDVEGTTFECAKKVLETRTITSGCAVDYL